MSKIFYFFIVFSIGCQSIPSSIEVLVIGEGTGATSAAIQSARSGAQTTLITPLPWLGGMLTSAGVSATDGNHQLSAGLWAEFRDSLRMHYGGVDSLFTGWVSNTMFEPKVGDYYWKQIAANEDNLTIIYDADFVAIRKSADDWTVIYELNDAAVEVNAKIVIDGTDLGDVAAMAGATYDIGMDARTKTGESMAPEVANDIIQDLTYAAILEDYGVGSDRTINRPDPYDPSQFYCACEDLCQDPDAKPHPCKTMIDYGRLPNGKYMINWPIKGNDYYANMIESSAEERQDLLEKSKQKTLQFIYYIQTELGYKNLGIAQDEFPTEDGLPLMAYHREGRRFHGEVQLNVNHILSPYESTLYKTGIAVGDYPIDHHHFERADAPEIEFPQVPSFSIPMGALIPMGIDNLLIADKPISVTNIVNGSSRLQPVIVQVGQVAGLMAAMAVKRGVSTSQLEVRRVQQEVLDADGYLMPFIDVSPEHSFFQHIHRVAAAGLLRGRGVPYKWANQTWFDPDQEVTRLEFYNGMSSYDAAIKVPTNIEGGLSYNEALTVTGEYLNKSIKYLKTSLSTNKSPINWTAYNTDQLLTKGELAVLLDLIVAPFSKEVDVTGD